MRKSGIKFTHGMSMSDLPVQFRGPFGRWKKFHKKSFKELFWESVEIRTQSECWEWKKETSDFGYGIVRWGRKYLSVAHRIAWKLTNGSIPSGMRVCHHCDNPPCCNPDHLFLGTDKDNMQDCIKKGRNVVLIGRDCPCVILEEEQVRRIRKEYIPYVVTYKMLGEKYGVAKSTIQQVVNRHHWKHIV